MPKCAKLNQLCSADFFFLLSSQATKSNAALGAELKMGIPLPAPLLPAVEILCHGSSGLGSPAPWDEGLGLLGHWCPQ